MASARMQVHNYLRDSMKLFFSSFSMFERGDLIPQALENFCLDPNNNTAGQVYSACLLVYRMSGLQEVVNEMQKYETTSATLIPKHRDHYVHTVNVFLIGIAIYIHNAEIRSACSKAFDYPDGYSAREEEFLYRWSTAALFHDAGYPLQIAYGTIHEFTSMLMRPNLSYDAGNISGGNTHRQPLSNPIAVLTFPELDAMLYVNNLQPKPEFKDDFYQKYPDFDERLTNDILELLAMRISRFGFAAPVNIRGAIVNSIRCQLKGGYVDHAIFSAIILLKWTNDAFQRAQWNPAYFYLPTVDAATAILLHNSYNYLFQQVPFNRSGLQVADSPLAWLLMLIDNIQEYSRPSYGYKKPPFTPNDYSIEISDDSMLVSFQVAKGDKIVADIETQRIKSKLDQQLDIKNIFKEIGLKTIIN